MAKLEGAKAVSVIFRLGALMLSVAAAAVMGSVDSYANHSALLYFVVGSAISAICEAVVTLYLFVPGGDLAVPLLDAAAQVILYSASGAALAAGGCFVESRRRINKAAAIGVFAAATVSVAALTRGPA